MDFVVDASVAMGWLLRSQATPQTSAARNALSDGVGWVPCHFGIEIIRSLRNQERRNLVPPAFVDAAVAGLQRLPLKQDTIDIFRTIPVVVLLARHHRLRVADAAYLELALRLRLPLATRDRALAVAAQAAGADLFAAG